MDKRDQKQSQGASSKTSRERLAERVFARFPNRRFESDDDVFDALDEYDSFRSQDYDRMLSDHNKLTELMYSNPRVGAFISDVADGEDALVACVRYFGKELLDGSSDAKRMRAIRVANDEFVERHRAFREMEEAMYGNVQKSARSIERFMRNKKMSADDLDDFLDRVFHVCQHVFAGDLSEDVLELLYKGLCYDVDLSCAEHAAEVKGRNRRIMMERREMQGDALSTSPHGVSQLNAEGGYRLPQRRKSVWDM